MQTVSLKSWHGVALASHMTHSQDGIYFGAAVGLLANRTAVRLKIRDMEAFLRQKELSGPERQFCGFAFHITENRSIALPQIYNVLQCHGSDIPMVVKYTLRGPHHKASTQKDAGGAKCTCYLGCEHGTTAATPIFLLCPPLLYGP